MAFVALCLPLPAACFAADCAPLKQATSVDLISAPNGVRLVPVTINGVPKNFVFGTAAGMSTLSQGTVAEFGLHPMSTERDVRLLARNGHASNLYVTVDSFSLGGVQGKHQSFMVSPDRQLGSNTAVPVAGVLANDLMGQFDVEMDFVGGKLKYFLADHCTSKVVYWPATAIAVVPYSATKIGSNRPDSHLRIPVTLNGHTLDAIIDTGSPRSTLSAETAQDTFKVTADSPGAVPLGTVENDPNHKVFGYVFGSLAFEGVTISKPRIVVYPDLFGSKDPSNSVRTGGHIKRVDDRPRAEVSIGMDVLRNLHLYVASREHKLYITSGTSTASETPTASQSP
jgi:predicted aspartyl protease